MWTPTERVRPLSIVVLTILALILGVLALLAGAAMFLVAGLLAHMHSPMPMHMPMTLPAYMLMALGGFYVAVAVIYFVTAYGYWTGRGWAWIVGLALAILGIILGVISFPIGILDIIVNAVIIYLLTRPAVREYLGRAPTPPTPTL